MIRRFPSVFILLFVISGITLADLSRISSEVFLLLCLLFSLAGFLALSHSRTAWAATFFGMSLWAFSAFHFAVRYYDFGPNHVVRLAEDTRSYHIFGRVADWPDLKADRTEIKIGVDSIPNAGLRHISGLVLLRISDTTTALQRGDRVEFYGQINAVRRSASSFRYGRYLNMKGVFGIVYLPTLLDVRIDQRNRYGILAWVDALRDKTRDVLYRNLSPTSAALACGFLIGETRNIPTQVYHRFRDSGTLHLLAVSGSNVALILLFFIFVLRPLAMTRSQRSLVLLSVVIAFSLLSYGEPSVVRASIMAALIIIAGWIQRRHDLNNIIALAAVIILLVDPAQLFDIGFQLSFVIAWGLIFILPRVTEFFRPVHNRRWYRWLVFPLLVSVVAQVCSVGIIAFYFERVPLISPLANLIIVPLVSVAVLGILAVLLVHLILPLLGLFAGAWLNVLLKFILALVQLLGDEQIPSLKISEMPVWVVGAFYIYLVVVVLSFHRKPLRRLAVISAIVVLNAALLAGAATRRDPPGTATVSLFEIPGGTCAVVRPGSGRTIDLVITGMEARRYSVCERIIKPRLSKLGVSGIDRIFVLSAQFDAAKDILMMAVADSVPELYVTHRIERSFRDIQLAYAEGAKTCRIVSLGTTFSQPVRRRPNYYHTGCGLVLSDFDSRMIFCDRPTLEHLNPTETGISTLIVGRPWCMSENDLIRITALGYRKVVCSNIAQRRDRRPGVSLDQGSVLDAPNVMILGRTGMVTLNL